MTPDELVGIFCLVGGAILCVFGLKYKECTLSFFGSAIGAYLLLLFTNKVQLGFATQIVLSVLVSLIFAFICMKLTRVSVFLIAIIHATCISNLMTPGLGNYWGTVVQYTCLIILPSLFLYAPDVGILVSSAFFGAWIFVTGIEQFIGTGFPNPLVVLFHRNWDTFVTLEESAFLECLLVCSIMITSLVIQIKSMASLKEKILDELIVAIHEKVLNKLQVLNPESGIVGENEVNALREILIDIEIIEKVNAIINGTDKNDTTTPIIEDGGDMVTPGGEDDNCSSNTDKKGYFLEKLVGITEDSKPLL